MRDVKKDACSVVKTAEMWVVETAVCSVELRDDKRVETRAHL